MNKTSKFEITNADREIFAQMVDCYMRKGKVRIQEAFTEHPEWKAKLDHLPYSTVAYYTRRLVLKKKAGGIERKETRMTVPIPTNENQDPLNYCPGCGRCLANVRNTMRLEDSGKL